MRIGAFLLLSVVGAVAQPLTVYSEFAVLDAQGKAVAPEYPREILSPALARNAFTSFQVVVTAPAEASWRLFIAQNPEEAVAVTLYRQNGSQLERVPQPATGSGTQVFWMDLWTAGDALVTRIKIEPQLNINNDWVIYPMEARITRARVPNGELPKGSTPPGDVMRAFLCGTKPDEAAPPTGVTQASLRFRNAQQDRALAASAARDELQKRFGACDAQPTPDNPEWYLRVRDFLFQP